MNKATFMELRQRIDTLMAKLNNPFYIGLISKQQKKEFEKKIDGIDTKYRDIIKMLLISHFPKSTEEIARDSEKYGYSYFFADHTIFIDGNDTFLKSDDFFSSSFTLFNEIEVDITSLKKIEDALNALANDFEKGIQKGGYNER